MKLKLILISALVLTALNFCTSAVHAASEETIRLNNDGVLLLKDSKFDQAIAKLTEALRSDPTYARSRENLAIAYNNKGISLRSEPLKSVVCFRHCLFFDPNNAVAQQNLDLVIRQLGKDPTNASDRIAMGKEARKAGDLKSAVVELRAGLKIKDEPTVHESLGDVLRVLDQNEAAIDQYKAAVTAKESANLYTKLGQALLSVKRSDEAIDAYEKAVSLAPYDREALDSLVAGWELMVQQNPTEPANHLGLAKAFAKNGDFGQADTEARSARSLSTNQSNLEAEQFLAELPALKKTAGLRRHINNGNDLRARKMYSQAIDEYLEANKLFPDDDESLVKLGETYALFNDKKNAAEAFKTVLQRSPRNAAAKQGFELATAETESNSTSPSTATSLNNTQAEALAADASRCFKNAEYAGASNKFMQALALQPNNASLWRKLAEANYQMENFNVALDAYQRALQYSTAEADGLYVIATIYEHYGQADKAIKAYQDFVNFRSVGMLAIQANNRIAALRVNPKATLRLSSSTELAAQKDAENSYESARNFIKEKKWDEAVVALNRAISIRPNEGKFQYLIGCAYAGKADLSQATNALQRAAALEPENELYKLKLDTLIQNRTASPIAIAAPVADATVSTAKNYALLIGTDYYQDNEFKQLKNPILDCKTIGDVLKADYGWNVTVIENPTKT
jgi:tetratricopeptide (TPR) repeat protein